MQRNLRVGIIGANARGGWARESHVPAIQAVSGLELAAVANRTQESADAAAQAFGIGKAYGNAADMFKDPEIDLVTVAATLPAHRDLILGALAAGKHIYCEYPLGLDVAESQLLATSAQQASAHAAIGLQARSNPAVHRARDLIASGAIGRPLTARAYSPTAGFGPRTPEEFAYTEKPENGVTVVTIQSAHTIDLVIAPLGGLTNMTALASTQYPEISIGGGAPQQRLTFDHLLVQARMTNGVAFSAEIAGGRPPETPFHLEIIGEAGTLDLKGGAARGFQAGRLTLWLNGDPQEVNEGASAAVPKAAANVAAAYAALRSDIAHGTTTVPDFAHAVRLAQLIEDAAISSRTGICASSGHWPGSA